MEAQMPNAARVSDEHVCPVHDVGAIGKGALTVSIGFLKAARAGDPCVCPGEKTPIAEGEPTVTIEFQHAARVGDPTMSGGIVSTGCPTVQIGTPAPIMTVLRAAALGLPFVEGLSRVLLETDEEP